MKNRYLYCILFTTFFMACQSNESNPVSSGTVDEQRMETPDIRFGALFEAVQTQAIFPDSKTFVDCTPKFSTQEIMDNYDQAKTGENFSLKAFVTDNFELPKQYASDFKTDTSRTVKEHITALWPILLREPDQQQNSGSLLPLPHPYIVPGGRFGEIYYWDSYFTILGLEQAGKIGLIENMADNFAYLIDTVGYIPNGNRTYFLGRSQPPFFAAIVNVLAGAKGDEMYARYLSALEKEYNFWMSGMTDLSPGNTTNRRVVRLPDGMILNRYYDDHIAPRPESYKEDVELAKKSGRDPDDLYLNLRAACESGWDFSSRWLTDPQDLGTIHTTDIIPVDLNSLLFNLERTLTKANRLVNNNEQAEFYSQRATNRKRGIQTYCWDENRQFFVDYDFKKGAPTSTLSLAGTYPLYFEIAVPHQAKVVAKNLRKNFLKPGGLLPTLNNTGQQWDAPNGWAPLQWMAYQGLYNYDETKLADEIKNNWLAVNERVYKNTGKMVEKYNVVDMGLEGGGGEYPVQDGFGWTNGIFLKMLKEE